MTAPLIDRLLGHAESFEACYGPEEGALLREAALELARLESQLEAVRLAKPAPEQLPEALQEQIDRVFVWADAYPLDVFPEPDFKRVHEVLRANGLSLDCVSASNMRHVITRVRDALVSGGCRSSEAPASFIGDR
jgi:hypothetical protein